MDAWKLSYCEWDKTRAGHQEALCTIGNGYIAVRGTGAEAKADSIHYPGVYIAGGYNRLETEISDHVVENEDLVNWPNWLPLTFKIEKGEWFTLDLENVLNYKKEIHMKEGVLFRSIEFEDGEKRRTLIEERRFLSMEHKHLGALEWKITPLNWEGEVTLRSSIDGNVRNKGVQRYRRLNSLHLRSRKKGTAQENIVYLEVETTQSELVMAQAQRVDVFHNSTLCSISRKSFETERSIGQDVVFHCSKHKTYRVEKVAAFYTSKDFAISSPLKAAIDLARRAESFSTGLQRHRLKWRELWYHFDLSMQNMPAENMGLRLHIFHLLQTACHNTIGLDTSVPARGLHGEAYRGHIFWDELFIFPFYYLRMPELSRSLLMYRFRRLEKAKRLA
ncbi:MAG: glycoside hydrolase family 65 protein, partial [Bacteriovoracaceae bacterium]|nr:glycoside hydrolase family 65 protein [Bacteriovoracaceae bacterium]